VIKEWLTLRYLKDANGAELPATEKISATDTAKLYNLN